VDASDADADPITAIRDGWDLHLRYGIANPTFYSRIYGRAVPEQPCGVVSEVEAMLLRALQPAAAQGRLCVAPEHAAREILAASTGVILTLISQPADQRDLALSHHVRDPILDRITTTSLDSAQTDTTAKSSLTSAAIALSAAPTHDPAALTDGELVLLKEWLTKLSDA